MKHINPRDVFGIIAIAYALAFFATASYGLVKVVLIQTER
jgi:hypothetical protein